MLGADLWEPMKRSTNTLFTVLASAGALGLPAPGLAQAGTVYRCPGPPVLYTDSLTPDEARDRGCRTIEGAPVTVIQGTRNQCRRFWQQS